MGCILLVPILIGQICLMVWGYFSPVYAAYTFTAIYALFFAYLMFMDSFRTEPAGLWDSEEKELISKYHLALRFPMGAKLFCTTLNSFRFPGLFLWFPWLLWNKIWWISAIQLVIFFASSSITIKLDPYVYLEDAFQNRMHPFSREYVILARVLERLNHRSISSSELANTHNDEETNKQLINSNFNDE